MFTEMVSMIRSEIPDAALRTTFIVGYPGETGERFRELCDFVKEIQFDHVGVFTYSDEENTRAFDLPEKVPSEIATERRGVLMSLQQEITHARNSGRIGQKVRVLLEGPSEETALLLQGRMESQAPGIDGVVLINDVAEGLAPEAGAFVQVEITEAHDYDLLGRVVSVESQS